MRRSVVTVVVVLVALVLAAPAAAQTPQAPPPTGADGQPLPSAQQPGGPGGQVPSTAAPLAGGASEDLTADDSPEVDEAAQLGLVVVAERATILDLLGVGTAPPPPLEPTLAVVREEQGWGPDTPADELRAVLAELVDEGQTEVLEVLLADGVTPSPEVSETLAAFTPQQQAGLDAGQADAIVIGPYNIAVDDLYQRNGRAPEARGPVPGAAIASAVAAIYEALDDGGLPVEPDPEVTVPDVVPADEPADVAPVGAPSDDGTSGLAWVLAGLILVALVVGAVLLTRGRRRPTVAGAQFDELLEVSRRLAAARTPGDVEQIGADEAARLLGGAEVTTGAVVHRGPGGLVLGHETRDGVLVPDRLADGVLERVVATGQPVAAVVDTEPALRRLPAALVAVPVIGDGRVNGIALAVRNPDQPFTEAEVELLRKLGPITAAAMESARHVDDATSASLTDPLTGVGNRRRLEQDLPAELLGATGATAVAMIDLDHFKRVNDEHGHPAGDALLREVADVLRGVLRPGDGVYRYGGEEFAMVLGGATADEARVVAERARDALRTASFDLGDGTRHRVTASLGVAATGGAEDLDGLGLIGRADRALYLAKEAGRDRVVVASGSDAADARG